MHAICSYVFELRSFTQASFEDNHLEYELAHNVQAVCSNPLRVYTLRRLFTHTGDHFKDATQASSVALVTGIFPPEDSTPVVSPPEHSPHENYAWKQRCLALREICR